MPLPLPSPEPLEPPEHQDPSEHQEPPEKQGHKIHRAAAGVALALGHEDRTGREVGATAAAAAGGPRSAGAGR